MTRLYIVKWTQFRRHPAQSNPLPGPEAIRLAQQLWAQWGPKPLIVPAGPR